MVEKKRSRIARKPPPPPSADAWVSGGGIDPEVVTPQPEHSDAQTSKHLNTSTPQGKSSRKDYKRTTVYLPAEMHKRLKLAALQQGMEMSAIVEQAVDAWMSEHLDV